MAEKRVTVWVQRFKDRPHLMLQWNDPETGKRRSKSAESANEVEAERKRADKEYELNHGLHREPSKLAWATFREKFEDEYLPGIRERSRRSTAPCWMSSRTSSTRTGCGPSRPGR
jgi:hypothetical protein